MDERHDGIWVASTTFEVVHLPIAALDHDCPFQGKSGASGRATTTCERASHETPVVGIGNWHFKELIGSIAKILKLVNSFCQFICIYIALYLLKHVYLVS